MIRARIATVALAVIAGACTRTPAPATGRSGTTCPGDMVLVVRNSGSRPLDIYASRGPNIGGVMIGTANPGTTEIAVPRTAGTYFSPREVGSPSMSDAGPRNIAMETRCR